MFRMLSAGVWATIDDLQPHDVYQAADTVPPTREARRRKVSLIWRVPENGYSVKPYQFHASA